MRISFKEKFYFAQEAVNRYVAAKNIRSELWEKRTTKEKDVFLVGIYEDDVLNAHGRNYEALDLIQRAYEHKKRQTKENKIKLVRLLSQLNTGWEANQYKKAWKLFSRKYNN